MVADEGGGGAIEGVLCWCGVVAMLCSVVDDGDVTVQELSDLRGHARGLEESLANATSAHKESLSALTREHERLQEELSRTKTTSVSCQGCRCVRCLRVLCACCERVCNRGVAAGRQERGGGSSCRQYLAASGALCVQLAPDPAPCTTTYAAWLVLIGVVPALSVVLTDCE